MRFKREPGGDRGEDRWVESQPRASEIKWLRIPPICSLDAWLTLSHRQTHEITQPGHSWLMQLLTELQAGEQTTTTFSLSIIIRRPHPKLSLNV